MRRSGFPIVLIVVAVAVAAIACAPASPAAPTSAPAPAANTSAQPPQVLGATPPAASAAKTVDWPAAGRTISILVGSAAGGSTDLGARLIAGPMEQQLGTPVQVVSKVGAGGQIALTETVKSAPDGYTLMATSNPAGIATYMDPDRKAVFSGKDIQPIAQYLVDPITLSVAADSPFKTMKDLVDHAKANPDALKAGVSGSRTTLHLVALEVGRVAGAQFSIVNFDGGGPAMTALLGGHVDFSMNTLSEVQSQHKAGQLRVLGVAHTERSRFLPDVPTMESQGYPVYMISSHILVGPAGMDPAVVATLEQAVKNALETEELKTKMNEMGVDPRFMDTAGSVKYFRDTEEQVKQLLELASKEGR